MVEHNRQARVQRATAEESELVLMIELFEQAGMPAADIHETTDFFKARLPLLEPEPEAVEKKEVER